ncbi:hypothetical protein ACHJH3_06400 [Campylobacter sp. MOP7]|uniref:hypothetical protein n=1 Tax=Campylobacter canis TaxID=3378588 RepID=UPI00387E2E30
MLKNIFFCMALTTFLLSTEFTIKYWKIPHLNVSNFNQLKRDEDIFRKWSYESYAPIRYIDDIDDQAGVNHFSFGHAIKCDSNKVLELKQIQMGCLVLDSNGRDFSLKRLHYHLNEPFDVIYANNPPVVYAFENQFALVFVDFTDTYYINDVKGDMKIQYRTLSKLITAVAADAKIDANKVFVIGNFGTTSQRLKEILNNTDISVYNASDVDFIADKKGFVSQNVVAKSENQYIKKVISRTDIATPDVMNKNELPYYPIELKLDIPNIKLFYW